MTHRLLVQYGDPRQVGLDGQQVGQDLVSVLTSGFEKVDPESKNSMLPVLTEAPVVAVIVVVEPGTLAEQRSLDLGPRQSGDLGPAPGHPQDGLPEEVEPLPTFPVHLGGLQSNQNLTNNIH